MDSKSTKEEKLGQTPRLLKTVLKKKLSLVYGIKEEKEEIRDELIINTLNDQLYLEIIFWCIERTLKN